MPQKVVHKTTKTATTAVVIGGCRPHSFYTPISLFQRPIGEGEALQTATTAAMATAITASAAIVLWICSTPTPTTKTQYDGNGRRLWLCHGAIPPLVLGVGLGARRLGRLHSPAAAIGLLTDVVQSRKQLLVAVLVGGAASTARSTTCWHLLTAR